MNETVAFIKHTATEIIKKMHAAANLEVRRRESSTSITTISDNICFINWKKLVKIYRLHNLLIRQMVNSNLKEPLSIVIVCRKL